MTVEDLVPGLNIEDTHNEFKGIIEEGKAADSDRAREIGWLKTVAAFANTDGGSLYVGVEDKTHKLLALDHDAADKIVLMVHRQIKQRLEPAVPYRIEALPLKKDGRTRYVLRIDVSPSKILPVTLHEDNLLGIYVRSYGSTVLASPEQIRDLVLMSDNNPFDTPFTEEKFDRACFGKLFSLYKERTGTELTKKALVSAGFMDRADRLSKGAALFSDGYGGERSKVVCTLWPELTKGGSLILASEEFSGNLLDSIEFAVRFVQNHSVNGYRKEDTGRSDYFSYPVRSVTEGIVNAVAHRNYFMTGSQIEVNLFKDRLEITSPGALLGVRELKKEKNISSIIPRRRNELICAILVYCRYMESKGSGFDKIESDYAGRGEAFRPFISSGGSSFTLVLPNLTFKDGVIDEGSVPEVHVRGLLSGRNDIPVLSFCFGKERSAKEIAEYLGIQPSSYFRKQVLAELVRQGYLLENKTASPSRYMSNPDRVFVGGE